MHIPVLIVLLFLSAIFSLIEAAFLSISSVQFISLVKEKKKGAVALSKLKQTPHKVIIALLFSNTIINFTAVAVCTDLFIQYFPINGIAIATVFMTAFVLFFAQITPKIIAEQHASPIILFFSKPLSLFIKILKPIIFVFEKASTKISDPFTVSAPKKTELSLEEFKTMVSMGKSNGVITSRSAQFIENVLSFEHSKLVDIMMPKEKVSYHHSTDKISTAISKSLKDSFTKFPVIDKKTEKIAGYISYSDLLAALKAGKGNSKVKSIVHEPFIVPETKSVEDLFYELVEKKLHMAIIVNEFGSFSGIVTIHGMLNVFIGDIVRVDGEQISASIQKNTIVDGKMSLDDINKALKCNLTSESVSTIAGYIEEKLQHMPKKGEKIQACGHTFEIDKAGKQKVETIKIRKNS